MMHAFFTLDAYTVATINTEAGATSQQTRVVRNSLLPVWNQKITFSDVALGNMLSLALYDHKKLTSDVYLGQVSPTWLQCSLCPSGPLGSPPCSCCMCSVSSPVITRLARPTADMSLLMDFSRCSLSH